MTTAPPSEDWRAAGFGVYVHWPFCLAKCPYCDFNSHVSSTVDHAAWRSALVGALEAERVRIGPRSVDTVFFGGGTPSLMPAETVAAVIDAIDRLWGLAPKAEISLEANPTSVEADRFRGYAAAGVNRLSMGVQALNDADLRALGRRHSVAEAQAAFKIARSVFDRVSFDLIYARQGQTPAAWRAELSEALSMAVDHLSLYQLTIEDGTRFGDLAARGRLRDVPCDDDAAQMYEDTQALTGAAGMGAYEVSNHAHPGSESRHNLIYWRYGDYIGVGPGAHGRVTRDGRKIATETIRAPSAWLTTAAGDGVGRSLETDISPGDQAEEYAMTSLRLTEGMDLERYARLAAASNGVKSAADVQRSADDLQLLGLVRRIQSRIVATPQGRMVLNRLTAELLT